jgi:hypothetical protein
MDGVWLITVGRVLPQTHPQHDTKSHHALGLIGLHDRPCCGHAWHDGTLLQVRASAAGDRCCCRCVSQNASLPQSIKSSSSR